jgi:hydrophobe/amphiphile efflux-1 (HAE1) family protein
MSITELCVRRPVLAWMLMAATVLFGLVAATRIGISQFPDVDFPTLSVGVTWEGASPEVIEHDVIEPLEEALVQVEGLRTLTSVARQGGGTVTLELDLSRDVDLAMQDATARVSQAQRRLPRDSDPPVVSKTNPEDNPIMWVGLSGPFAPAVLSDYARYRVKERLQTIPGVGEVMAGGSVERNVRIWMDAEKLAERGLTVGDVSAALQREHVELPAGRIETSGRELNVRVLGEALDLAELRRVVVREQAGGVTRVEDVALVEDGFEDVRRYSRVNGEPAQGLGIKKQRGSNAVAVAEGVRRQMSELQKTLPEGMKLAVNFDSTQFIEESVHDIEFELVLAVLLTALVCWIFLGSLSSTLNVALAIPMSLLGTIAVIYFLGFTLNTFTLLGLGLAVGIVVDDAIMVLENIYRHAQMGKSRLSAALEGTGEITFAALAATVAVCAIFVPVVFMEGVVGKFFLQFGVTLCVAVLLSYVEAVTLAPARAAQILRTGQEREGLGRLVERGFDGLARLYRRVLVRTIRWPKLVLLGAALVLAASVFVWRALPSEFVPSQDQSRLMVRIQTAVGASIGETDRIVSEAERYLIARPEVMRQFGVIGGFAGDVNQAMFFVTLVAPGERALSQAALSGVLRKELNAIPGMRAIVVDLSQSGFSASRGFPVEFSVRGSDWEELITQTEKLTDELRASGLVVDLDTDYQVGMPELRVSPDRSRAADLGVPVGQVATTLNALIGGGRIGKYSAGGRRVDVRLRLLAAQRSRPEDIGRLQVRADDGTLVPLASLVHTEERPALQQITRKDRERAISVFANVAPGRSQQEALAKVEELGRTLPTGYRAVLGGASVAFRDSSTSLLVALALGILIAYMVLGAQFNSYLDPVTVLTILPLSVAGAAGALYLGGKSLNIFSMIGLLLLMGIVKKNSIILVDYANQAKERGNDAVAAMLEAGPTRLRPILMTSMATLTAAVPPALALGPGAEVRAPMALAVIGGLFLSTLLSLIVVPAFYVLADRLAIRVGARRGHSTAVPEGRSLGST